jgi:hypothetical protein
MFMLALSGGSNKVHKRTQLENFSKGTFWKLYQETPGDPNGEGGGLS